MSEDAKKEESTTKRRGPGRPKGSKNKSSSKKTASKKKASKKKVTKKKISSKKVTKKKAGKKKTVRSAAASKTTVRKKGRPKKAGRKKTAGRRGPGRPPKGEPMKISDAINRLVDAVEDLRDATRVYAEQEIAARQAVIKRFQQTLKGAMGQVEEAAEKTLKRFKG